MNFRTMLFYRRLDLCSSARILNKRMTSFWCFQHQNNVVLNFAKRTSWKQNIVLLVVPMRQHSSSDIAVENSLQGYCRVSFHSDFTDCTYLARSTFQMQAIFLLALVIQVLDFLRLEYYSRRAQR